MLPPIEILFRLILGAVLGGIIGFEREIHGRAAGFRTQLIVCLAAVLIMVISERYHYYIQTVDASFRVDPARIAAGAIIGVGFLGAGVIIKSGFAIRGLTTAASIWIVSAIGLAIGGGLYIEGIMTTFITVLALLLLRKIESKIQVLRFYGITVVSKEDIEDNIKSLLKVHGFNIHSVDYKKDGSTIAYHFTVSSRQKDAPRKIFQEIKNLPSIDSFSIDS